MPDLSGPFHHQATNRRYWWSESRQRYVYDDGTPVPISAPAAPSAGGTLRNIPGGDTSFRPPSLSPSSPSNAQSIPRYVPPAQPPLIPTAQPTVLYTGSSQPAGASATPINWKKWRPGQTFNEGDTIHIQKGEGEPPIKMGQLLGSGSFATVLAVQVKSSSNPCALKIYKSRPSVAVATFRQKFENEIHNMGRVSHRHIAKFYGAYIYERKTQPPEFGILMEPVADGGTLEYLISTYRENPSSFSKQHKDHLATAFGCLSSALEFVHRHMIRHKDVKTDNILIHKGRVLLTDFGSSWAGIGDMSLVTNTENPQGYTPRYAAPEVIKKEPRSAKSDVFSLGGVFYEILSAIEPRLTLSKAEYWKTNSALRNAFAHWKNALAEVTPLIYRMLDSDQDERPSARALVESLLEKHFCSECWQDRRTMASLASGSGTGKQLERTMAGLSLQASQPVASGPALTFAPSTVTKPSGFSGLQDGPSSSARRGSTSTPSTNQRTAHNYEPRSKSRRTPRDNDDSDGDTL